MSPTAVTTMFSGEGDVLGEGDAAEGANVLAASDWRAVMQKSARAGRNANKTSSHFRERTGGIITLEFNLSVGSRRRV
jgi:hypothetical protein